MASYPVVAGLPPGSSLHLPTRSAGLAPAGLDWRAHQDSHPHPGRQHRQMRGQGCGQTSAHGPEWGKDFLPTLKPPAHPGPTGFSHLPFLGLVGSPSTVLMLSAGGHPREVLGSRASLWVRSSGRDGLYTDLGHRATGAQEGVWERGQLRERWPGKVPLASGPSHWPSSVPLLSRGREVPQPRRLAQAPMELPAAAPGCPTPTRPALSCLPHHDPSGGFGHGSAQEGVPRPLNCGPSSQ